MTENEEVETGSPADKLIKSYLKQAIVSDARIQLPPADAAAGCETNAELVDAYAKYYSDAHAMLWHSTVAHILIRLQESHPALAAGIAQEVTDYLDAGDAYPEWIWQWATERGINPETYIAEKNARYEEWLKEVPLARQRKNATQEAALAAEKSN